MAKIMRFVIVRNGEVKWGPAAYDASAMTAIIARNGGGQITLPAELTAALELKAVGINILPVYISDTRVDPLNKLVETSTREIQKDRYVIKMQQVPMTAVELAAKFLNRLSAYHDSYEVSLIPYKGVNIYFNELARSRAKEMKEGFEEGLLTSQIWRGKAIVERDELGNITSVGPSGLEINSLEEVHELRMFISKAYLRGQHARQTVIDEITRLKSLSTLEPLATYDWKSQFDNIVKNY